MQFIGPMRPKHLLTIVTLSLAVGFLWWNHVETVDKVTLHDGTRWFVKATPGGPVYQSQDKDSDEAWSPTPPELLPKVERANRIIEERNKRLHLGPYNPENLNSPYHPLTYR